MQIYYNQIDSKLKESLKPIYIIAGDEIYQEELCVEKIIKSAKTNDFLEHDVIYVEKSFDWSNFESLNSNLSLFSSKKIIELRFLTKSVGLPAEKKILEISENFSNENILIFRLPELKASDFKKKYLGVNNINVGLIRLYPMTKKNIVDELIVSSKSLNYKIDVNCIKYIADLYEGNMVSANQALIKLDLVIKNKDVINLKFLEKFFSSDVDFEANNLVDYAIEGNIERVNTCIDFLKQNDYPAQYVIWSFIRSFRTILSNLDLLAAGKSRDDILKNIWPFERKNLMSFSLNKLSQNKIESYLGVLVRIDMQSKNILSGNIWDSIHDLSISIAKNKLSVIKYT